MAWRWRSPPTSGWWRAARRWECRPAKISLIYSHTGLRKFLETIGPAHTAELFHVGENIDSDRAARIGLVNHVVDDEEELEERSLGMAGVIAANAPLSLAGNKRVIRSLLEAGARLDPELERELVELRESCFRSEDFREGIAAFAEKRDRSGRGGKRRLQRAMRGWAQPPRSIAPHLSSP